MGDLTNNLSRHEFACKCGCGQDTIDYALVEAIQQASDWFYDQLTLHQQVGDVDLMSITINSGNRCLKHNIAEGGSKFSRHMDGRAADFKIKYVLFDGTKVQVSPTQVADYLDSKYISQYGVGWYNGRTHFDTASGGRRRWDKR